MATTAPNPYADMTNAAAAQYGINSGWFDALLNVESSYNPNAVSSAGAIGLGQLMPKTAASVGVTDPRDPGQNIQGSANYFSQMLQKAGGNYALATQYYNCGPGNTCPAGINEANMVGQIAGQSGAQTDWLSGGIWNFLTNPNNPITNAANATQSVNGAPGMMGAFAGKAGLIAVGALLIILAMVIPNRQTIIETAAKAAG